MKISYTKNIDFTELDNLFKSIGWKPRDKARWEEALSKSSFVCSFWDKNKLISLGRILEDGTMCMFYDIGVHPDYQKKGIGAKIMDALIDQVKGKKYASIGLFAWEENPDNMPFYEKFGFEKVSTGMELVKFMVRE